MGSTHWNGDRDEVEDFEFTLRELSARATATATSTARDLCRRASSSAASSPIRRTCGFDLFPEP